MRAGLTVVRPGMLTTVQDLGRVGFQHLGVPVAGPMDWYSHRLANRLAGNEASAAALEVTLIGPELETDADVWCAVAGAAFDVTVGGDPIDCSQPFAVPAGERVRFGARHAGARATLAVRGGIDVPPVFGSRATHLVCRMGPFGGRQLAAGDRLPVGAGRAARGGHEVVPLPLPSGGARLRVLAAPHRPRFTGRAWEALTSTRHTISSQSNRMGYRLEGARLTHAGPADILSEATPIGSLQVPASGQPILLMADRQTTGGYPIIATVITADLPIAGQLAPGDWVEFRECTREQAMAALAERRPFDR